MTPFRRARLALLAVLLAVGPAAALAQAPPNPAVDAAKKQAIVDEVATFMNRSYVFPETAKKLEARLRERLANGGYAAAATARDFARAVARDILEVTKDRHTGFVFDPEMTAEMRRLDSRKEEEVQAARERQRAAARRRNFNWWKVERLPGNVGYVDFRSFASPSEAGPTAVAAMNFLAHTDALIVDLRQNGGGDPAMIQLVTSYFFDEPAHLNDLWSRETDSTQHYWTLPYVPGPRMAGVDLYVLTSARTFSGAEEFTYNLKNLKRATIVGETTGGGAHPTDTRIVQGDYVLRVPFARAINPVSKTNWEGTGVAPDVAVPAAQAYDVAYRMALEKLAAKAADPRVKSEVEWVLAGVVAKAGPVRLDAGVLASYAGEYGDRKVTFEDGQLFYQRVGPKARLLPMTATLFAVEGVEYFRVEFVVRDGRAVEITGRYDNGTTDASPRTK